MYAVYGVVVELYDPEVRHAGDALRTHHPQLVVRQVPENTVYWFNNCSKSSFFRNLQPMYVVFPAIIFKIILLSAPIFHCFRGMLGLNLGLPECTLLCASWSLPEAGVLKKEPAKEQLTKVWFCLSRLPWTRESTIGRCTQPANSQLIQQSNMKYLGLARLAERG